MVRPTQILPTGTHAAPLPPPGDWQTQAAVPLLKNVLRLTAPNPGVMTGPGTNSYLVGDVHTGFIAIDPGPADADHLQRLWQAAAHPDGSGGNIAMIVCTHSHPDHSPGAAPLQALCQSNRQRNEQIGGLSGHAHQGPTPPILGLPSAPTARAASAFSPDRVLHNQELLTLVSRGLAAEMASNSDGVTAIHTLQVIHTPGHAANHVCLLLVEDGVLFSGDHILNGSTTVIDPPDGNMTDYLGSLDALSLACTTHGARFILPAHGHVMDGALEAIAQLKHHRLAREAKIRAVIQANPQGGLDEWLPLAYDDVHPRIWPVAKRSLMAHVERLTALKTL